MIRLLALLSLCLAPACASTPIETVFVPTESPLKLVHADDQPGTGTICEYVPPHESLEGWQHLVTIQFLEGVTATPDELMGKLEREARQHGGTLAWKVLESDGTSVLYEWSLLDCPKAGDVYQDQCELARLLRGNDGLHRIAYTERARSMDPGQREYWLTAFRAAYVVKGDDRAPVVVAP